MKKTLLFLIFAILGNIYPQDAPSGHTTHYSIRMWSENANPSADSLNQNWVDLDNALYNLIVTTDTTQLQIRNDTLIHSNYMSGQNSFGSNKTLDTIAIAGIDSSDIFVVTQRDITGGTYWDYAVTVKNDTVIVGKSGSEAAEVRYNWIWIRHYN